MSSESIRKHMEESGLHHKHDFKQLLRNSIRIKPTIVEETKLTIGQSKIGGRPDLPSHYEWPCCEGKPLTFIAQLNMAEVHEYDTERSLPSGGLLYFFYDAIDQPWGFDPADVGSWKVIYYAGEVSLLERRDEPAVLVEPDEYYEIIRFAASELVYTTQTTIPSWASQEIVNLQLSKKERAQYDSLYEKITQNQETPEGTAYRLLGHPDMIQDNMQLECQLVTNGIYCGDVDGYQDPRRAELELSAAEWRLLLQIDSNDETGMQWGDVGRIYFWIREQDLLNRSFDQTWLVLQCT